MKGETMRLSSLFLLLLGCGAIHAASTNPNPSLQPMAVLPDSIVHAFSGCWETKLFRTGRVRTPRIDIVPVLEGRVLSISIDFAKYNDYTILVNILAAPAPRGSGWNCLWIDSCGNLQPASVIMTSRTIYVAADLPDNTQEIYLMRKPEGDLRVVHKSERDGIATFLFQETLLPCVDAAAPE